MNIFITNFDTTEEFAAFSATSECLFPHVSYTKDNRQSYFLDIYKGHDYVEIGGLKWATMNIGATGVTDYGLFFQWGDTQGYTASEVGTSSGKKPFYWDDYKYFTVDTSQEGDAYASGKITKYNSIDGKTVLDLEDDAAHANWGGSWRMPTTDEYLALRDATTSAWTSNYEGSGVSGLVLTDKTDSSKVLFFPAAGTCFTGSVHSMGSYGGYWSSSRDSNTICFRGMYLTVEIVDWQSCGIRCFGKVVRGILNW